MSEVKELLSYIRDIRRSTIGRTEEGDFGSYIRLYIPTNTIAKAGQYYAGPRPQIRFEHIVFDYTWDMPWVEYCWDAAWKARRWLYDQAGATLADLTTLPRNLLQSTIVYQWEATVLISVCWPVLLAWEPDCTGTLFSYFESLQAGEYKVSEGWFEDAIAKLHEWGYGQDMLNLARRLVNAYFIWRWQSSQAGYKGQRLIKNEGEWTIRVYETSTAEFLKERFSYTEGVPFLNTAELALAEGLSALFIHKGQKPVPAPIQLPSLIVKQTPPWIPMLVGGGLGAAVALAMKIKEKT